MKKLYISLMLLTTLGLSSFNSYAYYSRAGLGVGVGLGSFAAGALIGSAISRDGGGYSRRYSRRYMRDLERENSNLRIMVRDLELENSDLKKIKR